MNTKYFHWAFLPLFAAATVFTACTGDDPLVNPNGEDVDGPYNPVTGLTRFTTSNEPATLPEEEGATAAPHAAPGTPTTKTYLNSDGTFWWTTKTSTQFDTNDNIFINLKDDDMTGTFMKIPVVTSIDKKKNLTDFFVASDVKMTAEKYQVHYTGKKGTLNQDPFNVSINALQHQDEPNNSQHLEEDGDCGTAWAHRNDTSYFFSLHHQATYFLFMPYTHRAPQMDRCKLIKIEVEDMDGKNIAGDYDFSFAGLAANPKANGSSKVTLTLGNNKKGWDLDEKIDTLLTEHGRDPSLPKQTDGAYMVIHPGSKNLKITYYVQYFTLQSPWYDQTDPNKMMWRYDYTDGGRGPVGAGGVRTPRQWTITDSGCNPASKTYTETPWVLPDAQSEYIGTLDGFEGETGFYTFTRELHLGDALKDNDYLRIAHCLNIIEADSVYNFGMSATGVGNDVSYYEWDAQQPFWTGWNWQQSMSESGPATNTSIPKKNDEDMLAYIPNMVAGSAFQNHAPGALYPFTDEDMLNFPDGSRSTKDMPSANQMAWYLQYGKAHYDKTTKWYMRGFNDGYTLCRGGVWLLKWDMMRDENGTPISSHPDYLAGRVPRIYDGNLVGAGGGNDIVSDSYQTELENSYPGYYAPQYTNLDMGTPNDNLRRYYDRSYCTQNKRSQHRATYEQKSLGETWGYDATQKPPRREIGNYFFIPFAGYYEALDPEDATEHTNEPWMEDHVWIKLKLVGVRTHLWSKTPWRRRHFWAMHTFWGATFSDVTSNLPRWWTDNGIYFYANEEYIAVSWYAHSVHNQARWGHLAGRRPDGTKWFK